MKTLLVFLLVVIAVSLTYAHNEEALKSSRIAAKLRSERKAKDEIRRPVSMKERLAKHFSDVKDKMEARAEAWKNGDVMAKRSTNRIRDMLHEKLQKLKELKEN